MAQYLLEGIGSDVDFLDLLYSMDCSGSLTCYGLGETSYYPTLGNTCQLILEAKENENIFQNIKIFPNPASALITIKAGDKKSYFNSFNIYNSVGQKVLSSSAWTTSEMKIDISKLQPGFSFLEIRSLDGKILHSFFVKE